MVNYGYDPGIRAWDESKKGILANSLQELVDQIKKGSKTELADACMSSDGKAPYIEVNGMYPGVRIRKITHLNDEQQRELITKADLIYTEIMLGTGKKGREG